MGIRETLNKNPALTTGATAGIIVIAFIFIFVQMCSSGGSAKISGKSYYSVDEGTTYFEDDVLKIAPYQKDGKEAVRAFVYKCGNGKPFVLYLERYTQTAKKKMEEARAKASQPGMGMAIPDFTGKEVKKPGTKDWVGYGTTKFMEITTPKCPDGTTNGLEPVVPE